MHLCFLLLLFYSLNSQQSYYQDVIIKLEDHVSYLTFFNDHMKGDLEFIIIHKHAFHHELTSWAYKKIIQEKKLKIIIDVWETFKNNSASFSIEDQIFVHEFSQLLAYTYYALLCKIKKVSLYEALALYAQIAALPLPELLTMLEHFLNELKIIFSAYGTSSDSEFSLVTWLKQYWWVPTIACFSAAISIVQWYMGIRTHQNYE